MKIQKINIKKIKPNPKNPRVIRDDDFHQLVQSIKEFPKMLQIRPIVVNDEMFVLGGNMRLRACQESGLKEVYIIKADELDSKEQLEFMIKDNNNFGMWDWDKLANEWDTQSLQDWGMKLKFLEEEFEIEEHNNPNAYDKPDSRDDEYSNFEIVLRHETKLKFLEVLNDIKNKNKYTKIEESILRLIEIYNEKRK